MQNLWDACLRRLEQELSAAQAVAGEPWGERIAGAGRAVRGAHEAVQRHVGEHLLELVRALEERGAEAAAELDSAARTLLDAYERRTRIDGEIGSLLALVGRPEPGDVTRTAAETVANAARALLDRGGEVPPRLRRDPRDDQPLLPVGAVVSAA